MYSGSMKVVRWFRQVESEVVTAVVGDGRDEAGSSRWTTSVGTTEQITTWEVLVEFCRRQSRCRHQGWMRRDWSA